MTVTATNRKNQFSTNGVTTEFTFDFAITDVSQVYAFTVADGVETPFANFTAIKSDIIEGGTLTTNEVLDGVDLLVYRDTALTQQVDYESGGKFPADSHEQALDKLTLQNQDQQEELDRTLKTSISNPDVFDIGPLIDGQMVGVKDNLIQSIDATVESVEDSQKYSEFIAEWSESASEEVDTPDGVTVPTLSGVVGSIDQLIANLPEDAITDIQSAAINVGTGYSDIIYSSNTADSIPGYILDNNITYIVPSAAQGKFIGSFDSGELTTTDLLTYNLEIISQRTNLENAKSSLERPVENYLKPNQNMNVPYSAAVLPNAVAEDYTAGDVFAYDYEAVTDIVGLTRTGGITSGTSGTYMRSYEGDFSDAFFGVQQADGAVSQTGIDIDYNVRKAGYTTVAVNVALAPDHYCVVLSPAEGRVAVINDIESGIAIGGLGVNSETQELVAERAKDVVFTNTSGRTKFISVGVLGPGRVKIEVNGKLASQTYIPSTSEALAIYAAVPDGAEYELVTLLGSGALAFWTEI